MKMIYYTLGNFRLTIYLWFDNERRTNMAKQPEPVYKQWYRTMIVDDQEDIYQIASAASSRLKDRIKMPLEPELTMAVYCFTFEAIMQYLKDKQKDFPEFWVNIYDTLDIGYDTIENDEDEKTGNFNIKVFYTKDAPKIVTNSSLADTDDILTAWVAQSMNIDVDYLIKDIFAFVKEYLMAHVNLTIERPELILLCFLIITEEIVKIVKIKRQEAQSSDYFITLAGLFQIHCMDTDKGEMILFKTEPSPKQFIKDDATATAKFEE